MVASDDANQGFLAGRTDVAGNSSASGSPSIHLVAGPITNVAGTFNGADFALPVLDHGEAGIEVTLVDLVGWDRSLRLNYTATLVRTSGDRLTSGSRRTAATLSFTPRQ